MCYSTDNPSLPPTLEPWRIALVITELEVGGAERQFVHLATRLDRELFEPHVFCLTGKGPLTETLRESEVPVTHLNARSRWDMLAILRLATGLREFRPDLLQSFLFHANMAGRFAAFRAGVPYVISGIRVAERRKWQLWADRLTSRLVDRYVCVSQSVARYSQETAGLDPGKILVIPNGIDAQRFAKATPARFPGQPVSTMDQVVLFVGRLEPQKNPELLIESFRLMHRTNPNVYLVMVGTGSLERSLRRETCDLSEHILWLGQRDDIPELLKAASCLALPSRWEGMPNVVMEAMAAGLPVVALAVEGVRELLADGKFGKIVPDATPEAFASSLQAVLQDQPVAVLRGGSAQEYVSKELTIKRMVFLYQNIYLELLNFHGHHQNRPGPGNVSYPDKKN